MAVLNCSINNVKVNRGISFLCCAYIIFLCSFRDPTVGTDSYRYAMMASGGRDYSSSFEFLYNFLLPIVWSSKNGYTLFFFIMAAFTWLPFYFILNKRSGDYGKYVLLLMIISNNIYFLDSLNAIRQMASTAMLVTSYTCLEKENRFLFLVFYTLAIGLHTTALIFLPFVLLSRVNLNSKLMIKILVITLIYSFLFSFLVDSSIFSSILGKIKLFGISNYVGYFDQDRYMNGVNAKGLIKLLIFPALLCALSVINVNNRSSRIYFWGIILLAVLSPITAISVRACMGLTVAELLVLPDTWSKSSKRQRKILGAYFVVFALYFAYSLVTVYSNPEELGPYMVNRF